MSNIHFIGWVAHEELGNHLKSFDVLLMCYSDCNFNLNACPAKLWDYLGTGRPIVANSNNPETNLWDNVVYVGRTPQEFVSYIKIALHDLPELSARRLEVAKAHTWDALGIKLCNLILEKIS